MKPHLNKVKRIIDYTDKSQYNYILNQSERSDNYSSILFELFKKDLKQEDFAYYPNTKNFKEKICEFYNVNTENLFLSDGSDIGIKSIFETFTTCGNIVTSEPSFPMYQVYASLYNCSYKGIHYDVDTLELSISKMLEFVDDDTNLIVVTRTFSKAFGAAGCRVGMTFSNSHYIENISKFRQMYEISGVSMKYCEFLLDNYNLVEKYVKKVIEEKEKIISMLKNYEVVDSNCNWIHFNNQDDNKKTKEILDKHKVLVKYCKLHYYGFRENWCRMTIQPDLSNKLFFKELISE
jgi:histidinol-phosphate/aromatic aminotransferase/cobyric acid decarboxylase-like protein